MSTDLIKSNPQSFEVVELDDAMLDNVVGGVMAVEIDANAYCPTTNSGCNMVAGCGGKG